MESYAERKAAN